MIEMSLRKKLDTILSNQIASSKAAKWPEKAISEKHSLWPRSGTAR
jgi:hypothetical protein